MREASWTLGDLVMQLAPALLLVGATACPEPPASASRSELPGFDAQKAWKLLEEQVALGPRPSGSAAAEANRVVIERELASYGLKPVRQPFSGTAAPAQGVEFCNVYADFAAKGGADAPKIILLSHYDTKRMSEIFVGANDGASSTAVLLEIARQLAAGGPRDVAYRFLFVDGEESIRPDWKDPDNRYGSRHHAARLVETGEKAKIKAVVVIDMVGDVDLRVQRDEYSTPWVYEAFAAPARKNGLERHVDGPRERLSDDHLSFLEIGLPAVTLIDLRYGPDNAWWHTKDDTLEHCSVESLAAIGKILLLGLPNLEKH
jgi:glutaminyl-peptide cyclotransferase